MGRCQAAPEKDVAEKPGVRGLQSGRLRSEVPELDAREGRVACAGEGPAAKVHHRRPDRGGSPERRHRGSSDPTDSVDLKKNREATSLERTGWCCSRILEPYCARFGVAKPQGRSMAGDRRDRSSAG